MILCIFSLCPTRYELVGENVVETRANRVMQAVIPSQNRVSVQPGDMLGIYYDGVKGPVPFENCNVSRTIRPIHSDSDIDPMCVCVWGGTCVCVCVRVCV